jgi:hypothetical protein
MSLHVMITNHQVKSGLDSWPPPKWVTTFITRKYSRHCSQKINHKFEMWVSRNEALCQRMALECDVGG